MTARRIYFTGLGVPLLNLAVAAALVLVALPVGTEVLGAAWWFFLALALIFLISAFDGVRWLRLGEKGFVIQALRLRLTGFHIRVEMDYDEVDRIEVIGRRISLLSRGVARFVALRSSDDRNTWISSWNFAFSRAALTDLAARIKAARGRAPEMVTARAGNRALERSPLVLLVTLAVFLAGVLVLAMLIGDRARHRDLASHGEAGRARILAIAPADGGRAWRVDLQLEGGEARRTVEMPSAWGHGRRQGDLLEVRVHPRDRSLFLVKGEASPAGAAAFIALLLIAFGGRFCLRNLGLPRRAMERVEECFRG